ncbi:MAG: hypothetical protein ABIN89_08740 [Chitinophagaceae bacterium]
MDFFVIHSFVESIKCKMPTPMDVYDAAIWSAIIPLREQSIELGNETVEFPDFSGAGNGCSANLFFHWTMYIKKR